MLNIIVKMRILNSEEEIIMKNIKQKQTKNGALRYNFENCLPRAAIITNVCSLLSAVSVTF